MLPTSTRPFVTRTGASLFNFAPDVTPEEVSPPIVNVNYNALLITLPEDPLQRGLVTMQRNAAIPLGLVSSSVLLSTESTTRGSLKLELTSTLEDNYSHIAFAGTCHYIFSFKRKSKDDMLCVFEKDSTTIKIDAPGIRAIACAFNYVFVLRESNGLIQCIRCDDRLEKPHIIFTKLSKEVCTTSLSVSDKQLVNVIIYSEKINFLHSYYFDGKLASIIELPMAMEKFQQAIILESNKLLLRSAFPSNLKQTKDPEISTVSDQFATGYSFYCVAADEQSHIYGIAIATPLSQSSDYFCIDKFNVEGVLIAFEQLPELRTNDVTAVSRMDVNKGYVLLECVPQKTFLYKIISTEASVSGPSTC